jgi:hypothetical protein
VAVARVDDALDFLGPFVIGIGPLGEELHEALVAVKLWSTGPRRPRSDVPDEVGRDKSVNCRVSVNSSRTWHTTSTFSCDIAWAVSRSAVIGLV